MGIKAGLGILVVLFMTAPALTAAAELQCTLKWGETAAALMQADRSGNYAFRASDLLTLVAPQKSNRVKIALFSKHQTQVIVAAVHERQLHVEKTIEGREFALDCFSAESSHLASAQPETHK